MSSKIGVVFLGKRGQITIPAKIRESLGIEEGQPLIIEYDGEKLILKKAMVLPVRIYTDEEVKTYIQEDELKEGEKDEIKKRWNLK